MRLCNHRQQWMALVLDHIQLWYAAYAVEYTCGAGHAWRVVFKQVHVTKESMENGQKADANEHQRPLQNLPKLPLEFSSTAIPHGIAYSDTNPTGAESDGGCDNPVTSSADPSQAKPVYLTPGYNRCPAPGKSPTRIGGTSPLGHSAAKQKSAASPESSCIAPRGPRPWGCVRRRPNPT